MKSPEYAAMNATYQEWNAAQKAWVDTVHAFWRFEATIEAVRASRATLIVAKGRLDEAWGAWMALCRATPPGW
jgi:hypothetical protein